MRPNPDNFHAAVHNLWAELTKPIKQCLDRWPRQIVAALWIAMAVAAVVAVYQTAKVAQIIIGEIR